MRTVLLSLFAFYPMLNFAQLRINEIVSNNLGSVYDEDLDLEDWIEIKNTSSAVINLSGYSISDDPMLPQKWIFPSVTIAPNGYVVVFASGKNRISSELHTNFRISSGEQLAIYSPGQVQIDAITIPECPAPYSFGKNENGIASFFYEPTFNAINTGNGYWGYLNPPGFQTAGGFHPGQLNVLIDHYDTSAVIRYTLDGSEPDSLSPVFSPFISFDQLSSAPNRWSMIPTNPGFNYPLGSYDSLRANNRGWLPPFGNVYKAHIIRAKAFLNNPGALPSKSISRTFIIDPAGSSRFSFPVLSLIADSIDLFSPDKGIYVWGNAVDGNYNETGRAWERPAHLELFNENGSLEVSGTVGIKTHGGGGRHSTQKSLKLNLRSEYGLDHLDQLLFPGYTQDRFDDLILRSPGHRPDCIPRDDLASKIVEGIPIDYMHTRQVILFINGEYWGIHSIKENINNDYLSNKYSIPNDEVIVYDKEGDVEDGLASDSTVYKDLVNFIDGADLSVAGNYQYVQTQMDVSNYIDYMSSEIYFGNGDWPNSNIRFWRKRNTFQAGAPVGHDGRFRWILYDLDGGYGGSCSNTFPTMNGLTQATDTSPLFSSYTKVFRGLLENDEFKKAFVNRYCDLLNSWFKAERVISLIAETDAHFRPEMHEHVERWRYPSVATNLLDRSTEIPSLIRWDTIIHQLDSFAFRRPDYARIHLYNYFNFTDSSIVSVNVNDTLMGMVKVNSLLIHADLPGTLNATYPWTGIYFNDIPIQLKAIPLPGYQFVEWQGTGITSDLISVTMSSDTNFVALFIPDPGYNASMDIKINELMANNDAAVADEFGQYDDWLELYNPADDTVDLAGYYLTPVLALPTLFQIPAGFPDTRIPPHGFRLFWADNQTLQGRYHCNFTLPAAGGSLYLVAPDGITLVDSINYSAMADDVSYGRLPNGGSDLVWFYYSTPNESNAASSVEDSDALLHQLITYPNPNSGESVFLNRSGNYTIIDINGKLISTHRNTRELSIRGLSKGIYLIRDEEGNTTRFIRQ